LKRIQANLSWLFLSLWAAGWNSLGCHHRIAAPDAASRCLVKLGLILVLAFWHLPRRAGRGSGHMNMIVRVTPSRNGGTDSWTKNW
jgi:hypothetical protein